MGFLTQKWNIKLGKRQHDIKRVLRIHVFNLRRSRYNGQIGVFVTKKGFPRDRICRVIKERNLSIPIPLRYNKPMYTPTKLYWALSIDRGKGTMTMENKSGDQNELVTVDLLGNVNSSAVCLSFNSVWARNWAAQPKGLALDYASLKVALDDFTLIYCINNVNFGRGIICNRRNLSKLSRRIVWKTGVETGREFQQIWI